VLPPFPDLPSLTPESLEAPSFSFFTMATNDKYSFSSASDKWASRAGVILLFQGPKCAEPSFLFCSFHELVRGRRLFSLVRYSHVDAGPAPHFPPPPPLNGSPLPAKEKQTGFSFVLFFSKRRAPWLAPSFFAKDVSITLSNEEIPVILAAFTPMVTTCVHSLGPSWCSEYYGSPQGPPGFALFGGLFYTRTLIGHFAGKGVRFPGVPRFSFPP